MKTKKKKSEQKIDDAMNEDMKFCTECGDDLDNFDLKSSDMKKEDIKKNFENCRKTGKFNGDLCSKMFISTDFDDDEL